MGGLWERDGPLQRLLLYCNLFFDVARFFSVFSYIEVPNTALERRIIMQEKLHLYLQFPLVSIDLTF